MKRLLLRWHLGVGDALLCNGLVRVLVERGHHLILPCYPRNEESVRAMFADLGDSIEISTSGVELNPKEPMIALGHYGNNFDPARFDESFYRQAGVPFLAKWEKFDLPESVHPLRKDSHIVGAKSCERFIHDDLSRGFIIDMGGYRPDPSQPFWSHLPAMLGALEFHAINSCWAILADLTVKPPWQKRYIHRYARPDGGAMPIWGREWEIIDKPL